MTRTIIGILVVAAAASAAETGAFDRYGRVAALLRHGEELPVRTDVVFVGPGGTESRLDGAVRVNRSRSAPTLEWSGAVAVAGGAKVRFRQTAAEREGRLALRLEFTAESDVNADAVYFRIDVPRREFLGGKALLGESSATLGSVKPAARDFLKATGSAVRFVSRDGMTAVTARWNGERAVLLRDTWERAGRSYAAWVQIHSGKLPAGAAARLEIDLGLEITADTSPARVRLDASQKGYRFDGFGGNYCWQLESPVTQYTLDNLRVAWARTEMKLADWEPENDNSDPSTINWEYFRKQDSPGSVLRQKFVFAKQLQDRGIPQIISIWRLPKWLATDTGLRNPWGNPRFRVAPEHWSELLESVGAYLLYAKSEYGLEFEVFSFNEPNIGAYVLFTAEEHRESLKSLGEYFKKLGLKTKLLLAGATGPRGTHEYALPAANEPEALRHAAMVGFHTWGEGTPEHYSAWGDLAEWVNLPLFVTELGVDGAGFEGRVYDSYHYGMRELRLYQQLLLHARPRAMLFWQYTGDYSLAAVEKGAAGKPLVKPTARFWFIKHLGDLTPPGGHSLKTASNHPKVLFTAFAGSRGAYTLHVANLGAAREATIEGLPEEVREWRAVRTSETDSYRDVEVFRPEAGTMRIHLPARSLTSLVSRQE